MATTLVREVLERARTTLQDTSYSGIRWEREELLRWLNDAYLEIIRRRPEACVKTAIAGITGADAFFDIKTVQTGPDVDAFRRANRIINVTRTRIGGEYTQGWRAVRMIDKSILDDQIRDWPSRYVIAQRGQATYWVFDPLMPTVLGLYPRPIGHAGNPTYTEAEVRFVYTPAFHPLAHADPDSTAKIRLDSNLFSGALLDYILYRAYQKDAEYAANPARSEAHYAAFSNALAFSSASQQGEYDRLIHPKDEPTMVNPHQPT